MNIKKRLEKLEAVKIVQDVKVDIIHIIIEPDGTMALRSVMPMVNMFLFLMKN